MWSSYKLSSINILQFLDLGQISNLDHLTKKES